MPGFVRPFMLWVVCLLAASGCARIDRDTITQFSTIDALLAGGYSSVTDTDELLRHGDFGLGTFEALDGEMIVLDGIVYQAKADGTIHTPLRIGTPFASVSFFRPEATCAIAAPLTLAELEREGDRLAPNPNLPYAFKAEGLFTEVTFRAVDAQQPPYRPLVEVTKDQAVHTVRDVAGTLVGYRLPPFVKGINVPGYHLHFIRADRATGGHVLGLTMASGTLQVDPCSRLDLRLPADASQSGLDLTKDRTAELHRVEK